MSYSAATNFKILLLFQYGGGVERFFPPFAKLFVSLIFFLAFGKSNHLFVAYKFYRRYHHQYFAPNLRFLITSDTDPIAWIPS